MSRPSIRSGAPLAALLVTVACGGTPASRSGEAPLTAADASAFIHDVNTKLQAVRRVESQDGWASETNLTDATEAAAAASSEDVMTFLSQAIVDAPQPVAEPEPVAVAAPQPVPVAAPVVPAACATPCLLLTDHALADYTTAYATTCGAPLEVVGDPDYLRNCIYAASGYAFKSKRWQVEFRDLPWYQVRAAWAEADLSAVAVANIRELKGRAAAERAAAKPSRADVAAVKAWIAAARKGRSPVPVTFDGSLEDADVMAPAEVRDHVRDHHYDVRTADYITRGTFVSERIVARYPGKALRPVDVHWITAYDDGEGGGHDEQLTLYFEGDTLVAADISQYE